MKIIFFDCQAGISGDMILGALLDAGLDLSSLKKELAKLQISNDKFQINYKIQIKKAKKHSIQGTHLEIKLKEPEPHRNLKDIINIINKSKLSKQVKQKSIDIFRRLAKAEAKVHGTSINKIHFHEVGAVDAIVDIVGTVIALDKLGIEEVYASSLPKGKGFIKHAHGTLPIPAPATAELTKNIPTYQTNIKGELVTPTGAAIITSICQNFNNAPRMRVTSIGYGQGTKYFGIPNFLRVMIGETDLPYEEDAILQIETNIDDMDPKLYHSAIKRLMQAGALDAYITTILMKKKRQAQNLIVLCNPIDKAKILDLVFTYTTTIGTRVYLVKREKLKRQIITLKTKQGNKKFKVSSAGKVVKNIKPE